MNCSALSSYRGDPGQLFSSCCGNEGVSAPQASPGAFLGDCPALAGIPASVHRLSENLVTCAYSPSPLWNAQSLPSGSSARRQVCQFLSQASQPGAGKAVVHLSGETSSAPAFLSRWRDYGGQSGAGSVASTGFLRSSPAEYATCEAAADAMGPAYRRFLAARLRAEAGRLLPGLANEVREAPSTYAQHFADPGWPRKVQEWQSRLETEMSTAAVALRNARATAVAACFPKAPMGSDPASHLGSYGQTMAELLTAGLDAAATERSEFLSAEDPILNAEGEVMCAALPGLVLAGADANPWWQDVAQVRGCYNGVTTTDAAKLRGLLEGSNPRVLDAFRLVRSWEPREGCEARAADLHRDLHNLAVFYHASPLLAKMASLPESCRMTEAERAGPLDRPLVPGARSFPGPFPACETGVRDLCASLPNKQAAAAGQLGHGLLRGMVTPDLLDGRVLSVEGAPAEDTELNAALARALAARKNLVCSITQWVGAEVDEYGVPTAGPNFCRHDLTSPWLFSEDPGRGNCNRARAMVEGTPLRSLVEEFPTAASPYCPARPGGSVDAERDADACCCDASEYTTEAICLLEPTGV